MDWHGEAPFQRFGEAASNSVFGLCDFGVRLLVARERQTQFARWTFPSDDDNQMKMSLPELALFGHRSDDDEGLLLGAKRTCRLSFGQVSELSVPLDRELLEEFDEPGA